jgi:hypothetical protein
LAERIRAISASLLLAMASSSAPAATKPDILFIVIDDPNDWVGHLSGNPEVKTPNLATGGEKGSLRKPAEE